MENFEIFDTTTVTKDKYYCKRLVNCLRETGILIIRDTTVDSKENETFLDLMTRYYSQTYQEKLQDARPEVYYQVGVTPENTETCKCFTNKSCYEWANSLPENDKPHMTVSPDPKWRYMWRIGRRNQSSKYKELNSEVVVPRAFRGEWETKMNNWGDKLMDTITKVTQMIETGLQTKHDVQSGYLLNALDGGAHILAPTGTDLSKHGVLGQIFAGFHYDIGFLTIHGKSNFPGLYIWLRNGKKIPVKIPDGCLLIQAGKQLEWITGGYIMAGYHEVVCSQDTLLSIERAKQENRSLWRISSTLFVHLNSDIILRNVLHNQEKEQEQQNNKYPEISVGDFMERELGEIKLKRNL